jgi:hypothetical protein
LAGRVLLKIVYPLTCRLIGMAVLVFRGDRAKDAELRPLYVEDLGVRIVSEYGWIIGQVPGA